MLKADRSL